MTARPPGQPTTATGHERRALLVLRAMMQQHMLDEFGVVTRFGCYDIVCRGLDGDPLPSFREAINDER